MIDSDSFSEEAILDPREKERDRERRIMKSGDYYVIDGMAGRFVKRESRNGVRHPSDEDGSSTGGGQGDGRLSLLRERLRQQRTSRSVRDDRAVAATPLFGHRILIERFQSRTARQHTALRVSHYSAHRHRHSSLLMPLRALRRISPVSGGRRGWLLLARVTPVALNLRRSHDTSNS